MLYRSKTDRVLWPLIAIATLSHTRARIRFRTPVQIAQAFSVHPTLVAGWKKQALEQLPGIFSSGHVKEQADVEKDELFQQIGRLKVELDFLKKRAGLLN
jgi:transposase-like protein